MKWKELSDEEGNREKITDVLAALQTDVAYLISMCHEEGTISLEEIMERVRALLWGAVALSSGTGLLYLHEYVGRTIPDEGEDEVPNKEDLELACYLINQSCRFVILEHSRKEGQDIPPEVVDAANNALMEYGELEKLLQK